jgi:phosphoenolpyruvate carboxylase
MQNKKFGHNKNNMTQKLPTAASLRHELTGFLQMRAQDPHANPAKLLAFRLSEEIASGKLPLDRLEEILCDLCKSAADERGARLAARAGVPDIENWRRQFKKLVSQHAKSSFAAFQKWVESEAIGLVATAHPTFALTDKMRARVLHAGAHFIG